ncbi:MAG TPA: hypothetical protein VMU61_09020 [Candidatus Aquilonibacter sp.]|nr:hypothetical protein [Candidatus Aquilonibacter sp.]
MKQVQEAVSAISAQIVADPSAVGTTSRAATAFDVYGIQLQ